jgi:peptidyl-prolyl cis-trans isomerase C
MAGFSASGAWAAGPVLVQGPEVLITADDMQADSLRMPEEMRGAVLSRPKTVSQIATNLYVRRALANKAQAQGLGNDPQVAAALQVARDKVLSDALLAKIDKDSAPSDAVAEGQARNNYKAKPERFQAPEQVQVRHILIAGTDGDARAQAEKILEELKAGANFAQLAKERSADTGSAAKGGDLGLFARGRMVPEFDEAAFALKKPGDLSSIVETKFGFHILKLDARRPAGLRPYEEVREELIKEVRGKLQQDARVAEAEKVQQGLTVNNEAIEAFAATHKAAP